jgi:hypothetical protein
LGIKISLYYDARSEKHQILTDGFYSRKSDAKLQEGTNNTDKLSQNLEGEESGFKTAWESSENVII